MLLRRFVGSSMCLEGEEKQGGLRKVEPSPDRGVATKLAVMSRNCREKEQGKEKRRRRKRWTQKISVKNHCKVTSEPEATLNHFFLSFLLRVSVLFIARDNHPISHGESTSAGTSSLKRWHKPSNSCSDGPSQEATPTATPPSSLMSRGSPRTEEAR